VQNGEEQTAALSTIFRGWVWVCLTTTKVNLRWFELFALLGKSKLGIVPIIVVGFQVETVNGETALSMKSIARRWNSGVLIRQLHGMPLLTITTL
jgi:hypothetical protein